MRCAVRFRTDSGSLYVFEDGTLTRLSEHPVLSGRTLAPVDEMFVRRPVTRHAPIEVGSPARFWFGGDNDLLTTEITEIWEEP